jgi:hypothetical protein
MKTKEQVEIMLKMEEDRLQYTKNQLTTIYGPLERIDNIVQISNLEHRISILKWVLGMSDPK